MGSSRSFEGVASSVIGPLHVRSLATQQHRPRKRRGHGWDGKSLAVFSQVESQKVQAQGRRTVTFLRELLRGTQGTKTKDISR